MKPDLSGYERLGREPVATGGEQAAPVFGGAVRNSSEFEDLSTEIAKEESLADESVEWGRVRTLGRSILATQGKDLLVGVYLCRALFQQHRYTGLVIGLGVVNDLMNCFWDTMEPPPKRIRGRRSALEWLVEHLRVDIGRQPPEREEAASANQCASALRSLGELCEEKMQLQANGVGAILKLLAGRADDLPSSVAEVEGQGLAGEPDSGNAGQLRASQGAAAMVEAETPVRTGRSSGGDGRKRLRMLQEDMFSQADAWLGEDLLDSRAYRLRRIAMWVAIERPPRAGTGGETELLAPNEARVRAATEHLERRRLDEGLSILEALCARHVFWIDGQRMVAGALQSMGDDADEALKAVESETRGLLERFPDLLDMQFKDGSPFADEASRAWVGSCVMVDPDPGQKVPSDDQGAEALETLSSEANMLGTGGDVLAGALLLKEAASQAQGMQRFLIRLEIVRYYQKLGRADLAVGVLWSLEEEARRRQLDTWQPELAVELAALAYECHGRLLTQQNAAEHLKRQAKAFAILSELDPVRTLKLKPKV